MTDLLSEQQEHTFIITLNRVDKQNAFDDQLLHALQNELDHAIANQSVRVIVLKANGNHFSAGADLNWMQRMVNYTEAENIADALRLANVMYTLHSSPKPTIAMVHGAAFGGGAGLVAACDIAIAAINARFCFSEVKLGLIPAVISPYVVKAIGERAAKWLFMSAEPFDATQAKTLGLVHHCVDEAGLLSFTLHYAQQLYACMPEAVAGAKQLVDTVCGKPIQEALLFETAKLIAAKRVSVEGQAGLRAFLTKK
ncbi:MAG: gamma-carboxygeranoyl-CoA hydratase [Legionellales bacterium RIFCSPHIGHO2_12_FULL_42_9]|nr:MAG: gamma-carboxygeranoyl-CoA hydratase [Legionellales bacterium RIFCSPHIGHO2_12_FULL_42_9]